MSGPDWVLGVDPGVSGAFAVLWPDGAFHSVYDMPSVDGHVAAALLIDKIQPFTARGGRVRAIVEKVSSMPKQGVASTFKFGRAVGVVDGVLPALGIPVEYVVPGKWKREMGLSSDKEQGRLLAIREWPLNASAFGRKLDHNRAEACLLAKWWIDRGVADTAGQP